MGQERRQEQLRDRSGRQDGRTAAWSGKGVVGNLGAGQMADHGAQLEASNYTLSSKARAAGT